MEVNALFLLVVVPLGIGMVNRFLPSILRKTLVFLGSIYALYLVYRLHSEPGLTVSLFEMTIFAVDRLGLFVLIFIQIIALLILVFSLKGIDRDIDMRYFVLFPLTVSFCNGVVLSINMVSFLIFWGMAGLSVYLFGLLGKTADSPQTAKKTFIILGGSDALLIFGLAILWVLKPESNWTFGAFRLSLDQGLAQIAFICLLVAAFAKAGGFPFHTWVPDFAKDAPTESSAFLPASLDKYMGIYLLARMMTTLFEPTLFVHMLVVTLGAITVITAVMMAMNQHNGKRLLGYHAVSQVGYMIMGVASGSPIAFAGGLFHMVNHTLYKSDLFLSFGSVEKQVGSSELEDMGGIGKKMPVTFLMALIGALSISGIPPFNGFFSKWMVYQGLLTQAESMAPGYEIWLLICLILAIFGSALTLASFMKFIHSTFLGKLPEKLKGLKETSANQWIATGVLSALCLVFGIFAVEIPLKQWILPAVVQVLPQVNDMNAVLELFTGMYNAQLLVVLFLITFALGMVVYLFTKRIRYDEIYLGGMTAAEKFRVVGTEFYNEIRDMKPLRTIYAAAEKRLFDVYSLGARLSQSLGRLLQGAHPGQLQLYILYMIVGVLIAIFVIK